MTNFLQEGNVKLVAVPAGETWTVGQPKLLGDVLGIVEATNNQVTITTAVGDNGDKATMRLNGVITGLTKSTGSNTGAASLKSAYWDANAGKITAVSSGNTFIGYFWETCLDADTTCSIRLKIG